MGSQLRLLYKDYFNYSASNFLVDYVKPYYKISYEFSAPNSYIRSPWYIILEPKG